MRIHDSVEKGEMPPKSENLSKEQREALVKDLASSIEQIGHSADSLRTAAQSHHRAAEVFVKTVTLRNDDESLHDCILPAWQCRFSG